MNKIIALAMTACLLLTSCSGTGSSNDPSVATSAALTVQAALNQAPLASPTAPAAAQVTQDISGARASVGDVTNCRTGPGTNYQRITQLQPGQEYTLVGFYSPGYWIVSTNEGECWVTGELVTPVGNYQGVPIVADAPTAESSPLDGVSISNYSWDCDAVNDQATVTIEWTDKDGEGGYRIMRNDEQIVELPANTTVFTETITLLSGQTAGYIVIAFSGSETFSSSVITISC